MSEWGPLYNSQEEKDRQEELNGYEQYLAVCKTFQLLADDASEESGVNLVLTPDLIKSFHFFAIKDIYPCAGRFRAVSVGIKGSTHKPPPSKLVPDLVIQLCETINDRFYQDEIEETAYFLWKLNWIHPFAGGNGRTSRAVSYLLLCARLGRLLPGKRTLITELTSDRARYERALRDADEAWLKSSIVDVSLMKSLVAGSLKKQLLSATEPR